MIKIINPIQDKKWLNFIKNQEKATIFHHPSWLSVLNKQYHFSVFAVCSQDKTGNITAGIPFCEVKTPSRKKNLISLPFSDYCGFINGDSSDELFKELLNKLHENFEIQIRDKVLSEKYEKVLVGYKHSLSLFPSDEEIFKSFKKTQVQQTIQKSLKEGLVSQIRNDYNAINEFYNLHLLTRKKLGVPIQPNKFFYYFYKEIIEKGFGFIVLVYFGKKAISGGIFAGVNKIATYKFSASHPNYLNYRPNNLMLWAGIQEAKKRGFSIFDFGRTDLDTEGLRKFKLGWGTTEEPLYYSYYPKAPEDSKFKFLKDKIVSPIIRHSPKYVCRLSGELLYKYFG
jgi:hypothetical protein